MWYNIMRSPVATSQKPRIPSVAKSLFIEKRQLLKEHYQHNLTRTSQAHRASDGEGKDKNTKEKLH